MSRRPEVLSPAGSPEKLKTAIAYGCDAVYMAGKRFGLRTFSDNFDHDDMKSCIAYAHERGVKCYVTMNIMGLEADMKVIERMEAIGNKAGRLFGDIMRFTFNTQKINGLSAGPVHDVTAVAWIVAPELFDMKPMSVEIDLTHGPCYGRTVCDPVGRTGREWNALAGLGLDLAGFWDLVEENIRRHI